MTRPISDSRGGFTLVEVLVALGILLIGVLSVLVMFPQSLKAARIAAERSITSQTAHSVLSQVRASKAESLYNDRILPELLDRPKTDERPLGYTTSIQRLSGAANVYLQRVTFSVTLSDGRVENFTTFVAEQ